jgi:WD40 repeat protein
MLRIVVAAALVTALVAGFAGWQFYDSYRHGEGLRLVVESEQMLEGGRAGGDVLALQQLLAAESLGAPTAEAVANARRNVVKILENPPGEGIDAVTPVRSVAVSPDDGRIAWGSDDHTLRVWDTKGTAVRTMDIGDPRRVVSVAFSPELPDGAGGKLIATGSSDGIVQLWDAASGTPKGDPISIDPPAPGEPVVVSSVAFSPDGKAVAAGGSDGFVRLWDTASGKPVIAPRKASDVQGVRSVAFSVNGDRLVSGGDDGTVRLWNPRSGQPIGAPAMMPDESPVMSVAFSPPESFEATSGDRVAVGLFNGRIEVVDGSTLKSVSPGFVAHPDSVNSVAFSPGGSRIVSGGSDNTVRVWSAPFKPTLTDWIGRPIGGPLLGHHGAVLSVVFNADATRIVSGGQDGSVRVWDVVTGLPIPANQGEVRAVAFRPDGKLFASGGAVGTVKLWDAGAAVATGQLGVPVHDQQIDSVAFSPDGGRLVTGGPDGTLRLWDLTKPAPPGGVRQQADVVMPTDERIMSVAFSPPKEPGQRGGDLIVTGGFDGMLRVRDGRTLALISEAQRTGYQVWSVAFSPDGRQIVTGSGFDSASSEETNLIQLWKVNPLEKDGDPMKSSAVSNIYSVAFSPDGKRIASGSSDGTTRLWDVGTRRQIEPAMTGDQNAVMSVDFARNNRWIVAGAADGKVRLWDTTNLEPIGTPIVGHQNWARAVFSPDDKLILSGSADGNLHLWPAPQDLTTFICSKLTDNMSEQQWDEKVSTWIPYHKGCDTLPVSGAG